jgi:hypothetical protein
VDAGYLISQNFECKTKDNTILKDNFFGWGAGER